jgi:16S rRNA (uracil1498-N3)-methyltransferase
MPRFFIGSDQVSDGSAVVLGSDAAHLTRTLRVRPGEMIVVVEEGRVEHGMRVEAVSPSRVAGRIAWSRPPTGEPLSEIVVLQSIPARGMELAVESLVETGATSIWPLVSARSVVRPSAARAQGRLERWRTIARESAQLAGRGRPPEVRALQTLPEALESVSSRARLLACVVDAPSVPLARAQPDTERPLVLAVGPEGGFDAAERALLGKAGAQDVHLGPRVLPAWLAGAVAVSLLLAAFGELDEAVAAAPAS